MDALQALRMRELERRHATTVNVLHPEIEPTNRHMKRRLKAKARKK